MLISIRVTPRASRNKIEKNNNALKVYVTKPADGGEANKAVVELLAKYFQCAKSRIEIVKGQASRNKIIAVGEV